MKYVHVEAIFLSSTYGMVDAARKSNVLSYDKVKFVIYIIVLVEINKTVYRLETPACVLCLLTPKWTGPSVFFFLLFSLWKLSPDFILIFGRAFLFFTLFSSWVSPFFFGFYFLYFSFRFLLLLIPFMTVFLYFFRLFLFVNISFSHI